MQQAVQRARAAREVSARLSEVGVIKEIPLVRWLRAKWERHKEIEDRQAADLLQALHEFYERSQKAHMTLDNRLLCYVCGETIHVERCPVRRAEAILYESREEA